MRLNFRKNLRTNLEAQTSKMAKKMLINEEQKQQEHLKNLSLKLR